MSEPARPPSITAILPAKNEAAGLQYVLPRLRAVLPEAEIIVVDDGSLDETAKIAERFHARVIRHPYSLGNGASIKAGARAARGEILVFLDADGQHDPDDIPKLLEPLHAGYAMVVGARQLDSHANSWRRLANRGFNRLASLLTGFRILDLTSGFRAVFARSFLNFLYLLPNGFSYPTTITMAFFRSGLPVAYIPVRASPRLGDGKSKIHLLRDGTRFLLIILKIGALFSPMRLFLPISLFLFIVGCGYYLYTFTHYGRFTNMSALLFISSLLTFLIGILSEQVSSLHYRNSEERRRTGETSRPAPPD